MLQVIEKNVCSHYGVRTEDVRGRTTQKKPSMARAMIWYLLHYTVGLSSNEISKEYGRDPRTVKLIIAKMKFRLEYDKLLISDYNYLTKSIM